MSKMNRIFDIKKLLPSHPEWLKIEVKAKHLENEHNITPSGKSGKCKRRGYFKEVFLALLM